MSAAAFAGACFCFATCCVTCYVRAHACLSPLAGVQPACFSISRDHVPAVHACEGPGFQRACLGCQEALVHSSLHSVQLFFALGSCHRRPFAVQARQGFTIQFRVVAVVLRSVVYRRSALFASNVAPWMLVQVLQVARYARSDAWPAALGPWAFMLLYVMKKTGALVLCFPLQYYCVATCHVICLS